MHGVCLCVKSVATLLSVFFFVVQFMLSSLLLILWFCRSSHPLYGDLTIEWDVGGVLYNSETCSDTCDSINTESGDGYVTSTLEITAVSDLNISCVVNQNLNFSSQDPSIEIRVPDTLPPNRTRTERRTAQLIVTPAVTTTATTQPKTTQDPGVSPTEGKKDDQAFKIYPWKGRMVTHRNLLLHFALASLRAWAPFRLQSLLATA